MKILLACEESQVVCKAFRDKGHEAYSCDILPCSGGHPEWHIEADVLTVLNDGWDMMIGFPPCTYLCCTGLQWNKRYEWRQKKSEEALEFFKALYHAPINKVSLENPVGLVSSQFRKPDQYIQPYEYGHDASKKTGLWLKGLPKLEPTDIVDVTYVTTSTGKRFSKWYWDTSHVHIKDRAKERSKTFEGIAKAMAEQWG